MAKFKFTAAAAQKPPPGMTELVPPSDPSLPPGPPQMNKPVGSPPPPVEAPRTFAECMELARRAQLAEKAHLWAMLAQAHAIKDVSNKLEALNEFLGVYDEAEEDDLDDGEKAADPRFADVVAEGILGAVSVVKDDLMSSPLMQMAMVAAQRGTVPEEPKPERAAGFTITPPES
jgi:hypothetical protein